MRGLLIDPGTLPPECETLRAEVREFLGEMMPRHFATAAQSKLVWSGPRIQPKNG